MGMDGSNPYFEIPLSSFEDSFNPLMIHINKTSKHKDHTASEVNAEHYLEGILLSIICFVSILGNLSIWIIVLRSRSLRTITNSFLLALSAFDLLVSVVNMPVTALTIFAGEWIFSEEACKGFGFSNMFTLCGSVLSLCNISINRYVRVCKSTVFSRIYTKKNAILMIIATVVATAAVSTPPLLGWCEYSYIPVQYICFANWAHSLSYALFMIFCCFGIPLTVMIFCNYKIYKQVKNSKTKITDAYSLNINKTDSSACASSSSETAELDNISKDKNQKQLQINEKATVPELARGKRSYSIQIDVKPKEITTKPVAKTTPEEIRLARVLGIVVIAFFICWFPYCISMILSIISAESVHRTFHTVSLLIGYFNSCCNPIIYGILNKRFADGFKKLYCFWRK